VRVDGLKGERAVTRAQREEIQRMSVFLDMYTSLLSFSGLGTERERERTEGESLSPFCEEEDEEQENRQESALVSVRDRPIGREKTTTPRMSDAIEAPFRVNI